MCRLIVSLLFAVACFSQTIIVSGAFPQGLRNYLQLTNAQDDAISGIKTAAARNTNARVAQLRMLEAELTKAVEADSIDAAALGRIYADELRINAEETKDRVAAAAAIRALLTSQQLASIDALKDPQSKLSIISSAVCEGLLPPQVPSDSYGVLIPQSGCVGNALLEVGGFSLRPQSLALPSVRSYLDLTPLQLDRMASLQLEWMAKLLPQQERIAEVSSELSVEAAKVNPVAIELGLRLAEMETIRRELKAASDQLAVAMRALLTPEQLLKMAALDEARKLTAIEQQARCVGLSPREVGTYQLPLGISLFAHPTNPTVFAECQLMPINRLP